MGIIISIIIVTYNRAGALNRALESLKNVNFNSNNMEILVADNSNNEDTEKLIYEKYKDVRYYKMPTNLGVCVPRNNMAEKANGKYIYFMDDDAWVSKDVFDNIVDILESSKKLWAVSSKTYFVKNDGTILTDEFQWPEKHLMMLLFENGILVKKDIFLELGGFNKNIFYGAEGEDLALRAYYHGFYSIRFMKSVAFHPSSCNKSYNRESSIKVMLSRMISAVTSWPFPHNILRIFKTITINLFKVAIENKDIGIIPGLLKNINKVLFLKRYKNISLSRFKQFRDLCQRIDEINSDKDLDNLMKREKINEW